MALRRWLFLALALLVAGCGEDDEPAGPSRPRHDATTADLYQYRCASCHEGPEAIAPYGKAFRQMRPEAVMAAMDGIMAQQAAGLTPAQLAALAEFITGGKLGVPTDGPAPPMCAEWQNRIDVNRPPPRPGATARLPAAELPRFAVKWAFAFPGATRAVVRPTVAGGAVFVGGEDGMVYALDEAGGCVRWQFQAAAEVRASPVVSPWQAGDKTAQPSVYFGDAIGNAYGLDAATGQLLWKTATDEHPDAMIAGTPVLHEGRLYVPVASNEHIAAADPDYECCRFRGSVAALDAATGARVWKSWTIPADPRLTGDTNAAGTPVWQPAGAAVWGSPALDAKRKRLYVATGAGHTAPAPAASDAVIALDMETGKPVWRYQATPGDTWTLSCLTRDKVNCPAPQGPNTGFTASPLLLTLPNGKDIVLAAQTSGDLHAIDAQTGALVWRRQIGRIVGAGMAADGAALYVPTGGKSSGLMALDAATGAQLWFSANGDACPADLKPACAPGLSAAATTLQGGVLAGGLDGQLRGYDAATGQVIWSFDTTAELPTVSGGTVRGGSMDGGGPLVAYGRIFVTSGSLTGGHMAGNALIMLEPSRDYHPPHPGPARE